MARKVPVVQAYHAKDGWRWRMVARNGRVLADSGEAYSSRGKLKQAVDRLFEALSVADIVEVDMPEHSQGGSAVVVPDAT